MENFTGKANTFGLMEVFIKGILRKVSKMATEF